MDIIVTHESADFDALASAIAAARLYPEAKVVLGRAVSAPVRDFLAVHKDRFPTLRPDAIDETLVRRLIVVDVRRESRLRTFPTLLERIREGDSTLEVHLYDHHRSAPDDLHASVRRVEPVGAATTLLLEEIQARRLEIDEVEATLFALGIYADTGCFRHGTTTARDVRMGAFLLEQGASLSAMNRYLNPPLSDDQRLALQATLKDVRVVHVRGVDVGFITLHQERRCDGLDVVADRALELSPLSALFVLAVVEGRRMDLVARSRSHAVDVADAVSQFGGGGYASAASARIKHADAARVAADLEDHLRAHTARIGLVSDVMSSPVHGLPPAITLGEAGRLLAQWDHSGAPVLSGKRLLGVLSRRDIDKARRSGRLDLPVSSHMTQRVTTVGPGTSLEEALETLSRADVGRLLVVDGDSIAGILTRSDLLRVLYG